jgi:hypothetical protein
MEQSPSGEINTSSVSREIPEFYGTRRFISVFYVIHFRAYDQYSKTEPTYAQYYCLFIQPLSLVHLLPDMFRQ